MEEFVRRGLISFAVLLLLGAGGCPTEDPGVSAEILSFEATPSTVVDGATVILSWETAGTLGLSLVDPKKVAVDVEAADVAAGSLEVVPDGVGLHAYTLVATGSEGTSPGIEQLTVTVIPPGVCGDGRISGRERCDDGNTLDGDYCDSTCQKITGACGDGRVQSNEACDDGNAVPGDYCAADCSFVTGACGDSVIQRDEVCDDGNVSDGDYCAADCSTVIGACGDGVMQANEICDDGNVAYGDYCGASCAVVTGACGDGQNQDNEACDDGNRLDGDYCAADCLRVIGACGDGALQTNEVCDDGNALDGDYCAGDCTAVTGSCGDGLQQNNEACDDAGESASCNDNCTQAVCGDGILNATAGEICDDGGTVNGDGCSATCLIEGDGCGSPYDLVALGAQPGGVFSWSADTTVFSSNFNAECGRSGASPEGIALFTAPATGDYRIVVDSPTFDSLLWVWSGLCDPLGWVMACVDTVGVGGEFLDVTLTAGDTVFIVVDGFGNYTPRGGPFTLRVLPVVCGDGILITGPQACDDGNTTAGDGCSATCTIEPGWDCPAGAACTFVCGNGTVDASETCDDGNTTALDGCSDVCLLEGGFDCPTPGAACTSWALPVAAGDLLITEVMQSPASVADASGEWFEIHNPTTTDWQLMGLVVTDDATTTEIFTVVRPVGLPAGGYAVFAVNGDAATNGGLPAVDFVYPGFAAGGISLGNSTDGLVIIDSTGVAVLDTVIWDNGATFPAPNGASMALLVGMDATQNDTGAFWCTGSQVFGAGDMGSPGAANPLADCTLTTLLTENFDAWPLTGWTLEDGGSTADTWMQCTQTYPRSLTNSAKGYACVDSSAAGGGVTMLEGLVTPSFDASAATFVALTFTHYFNESFSGGETGTVEVSVDGGTSYTSAATYTADTPNGAQVQLDISAVAAGQATVQIRFHYDDGSSWAYYWLIDDVSVVSL